MARVNVEQKALTDPRFSVLGSHLSPLTRAPQDSVETAYGLYQMIRVWNYCLERGLLAVNSRDLDALHAGLSDAMIDAELGEIVAGSKPRLVRVKGGEGLLDWLEKKRSAGRLGAEYGVKGAAHGIKGGRPRTIENPPDRGLETPVRGVGKTPPPAPAPAPAPAPETKDRRKILPPSLEEVTAYFAKRGKGLDPEKFFAHYEANGWVQSNGQPIKKWQAAVTTWEKNEAEFARRRNGQNHKPANREDVLDAELRAAGAQ